MIKTFAFLLALFSSVAFAAVTFERDTESEIRSLIHRALWEHYDIELVSVLDTEDRTAEWGGFQNGYGLKTAVVRFVAVRNKTWSKTLNPSLAENCNHALYLLCQPTGHKFDGKLEIDLVFTTDGWKSLSRNFRNRQEFTLSSYLLLEGKPKEGYVLPPKQNAR